VTGAGTATHRLDLACGRDDAAIAEVLARLEQALAEAGCPPGACAAFLVVAEEMVSNVARYAWPAEAVPGVFIVLADIRQGADGIEVELATEDDGMPFDPTARPTPDTEATVEDRAVGGLGIHLVMRMTERQRYSRDAGRNRFAVLWRCGAPPG
jgi:anti-sigma regulatory factor (Ser/Thr protein kinase)